MTSLINESWMPVQIVLILLKLYVEKSKLTLLRSFVVSLVCSLHFLDTESNILEVVLSEVVIAREFSSFSFKSSLCIKEYDDDVYCQ